MPETKGGASAAGIDVKEFCAVHQESIGFGVAVCLRKAASSVRVDVPATLSLWSVSHISDPPVGKTFQIFVKSLEGKTKGHTVSWDTMLSEYLSDWTDMYAPHDAKRLDVFQSVFDGKVCPGDRVRVHGRLKDSPNPTFLDNGRASRVDIKGCGPRGPRVSDGSSKGHKGLLEGHQPLLPSHKSRYRGQDKNFIAGCCGGLDIFRYPIEVFWARRTLVG